MALFITMNLKFAEDYRIRNKTYFPLPNTETHVSLGYELLQVIEDFPETQAETAAQWQAEGEAPQLRASGAAGAARRQGLAGVV